MEIPVNMKWFALYTRPRHERKAHDLLMDKNMEAYLPMVEQVRQWKDRKKRIMMPLFTSYVFVKMELKDRYKALQTHGVIRLVSFGGEPAAIPSWQIEQLKQAIEHPETLQLEEYLREGDWVKVVHGPF
ncbi:MAG: UpxY family transcription antiterminator, partial [Calditrichia bacterium]